MKKLSILLLAAAVLLLSACGSAAPSAPETTTAAPETAAEPTTAEVTTETTTEEYKVIEPYSYKGSGDKMLELKPRDDIWGLFVKSEGDGFFAVTGYDENNKFVDSLVNTIGSYSGLVFDNTLSSKYLEIKAQGDWTVEQIPVAYFDSIGTGETYERSGDWVILVSDHGISAHIKGNADKKFFSVVSYDDYLNYDDLLVNTLDPYDGEVRLDNPALFVINAEGDWSITLED